MLSATPVNNKMNDIKNQIAFITEDNDQALVNAGINSIENTLKKAQKAFNKWSKLPEEERTGESFVDIIDLDYFQLLDTLTIARSRRHIEKYYDLNDIGEFPERLPPINVKSDIDNKYEFPPLGNINKEISRLFLAIYSPMTYIRPDKKAEYDLKYDMVVGTGGKFKQIDRDRNVTNLMRINMLKRMESAAVGALFCLPLDAGECGTAGRTFAGDLCGRLDAEDAAHFVDGRLNGLRHGHTLYAGLEFPVERHPGRIQVLVVHPDGQHEVAELPLRHLPGHFLPRTEGGPHLVQIVLRRIIRHIRQRHVGIEKFQGLGLFLGHGESVGLEEGLLPLLDTALGTQLHGVLKGLLYFLAVGGIADEVAVLRPEVGAEEQQRGCQGKKWCDSHNGMVL